MKEILVTVAFVLFECTLIAIVDIIGYKYFGLEPTMGTHHIIPYIGHILP